MIKPPSKRIGSEAGKALGKGLLSIPETRSLGGRVEAERAAAKKKYVAPKKKGK